jgi:hypothetical protein
VRRAGGQRDAQPEAELGDAGAADGGPDRGVRVVGDGGLAGEGGRVNRHHAPPPGSRSSAPPAAARTSRPAGRA